MKIHNCLRKIGGACRACGIISLAASCVLLFCISGQTRAATIAEASSVVEKEYPNLFELYKYLHAHPELSFQEEQTSARVAEELKKAGFEVTTKFGKHGVVAVMKNGPGKTVLIRTDLDGLPVKEQTGLVYASTATTKNAAGQEVSVMHACGHDIHMTCLVGVARMLAQLKNQWHGTIILIGQPAEEVGSGARAMLADGLFERFPRPDFCLALHDDPELPAGSLGYTPGFAMANVDSVNVIVHGVGGHGAYPHRTKDPIVLSAQIIIALQTIVSREIQPGEAAVITVGSIHGGSKHNIIPDEVRLQLTVRSYTDEIRKQTLDAIRRVVRGEAIAANIPEDLLPEVQLQDDFTPSLYNDPELTAKLVAVFKSWFGEEKVVRRKPVMGGEDFSEYGRVAPKIPVSLFSLGAVRPDAIKEHEQTGKALPSLHSPLWAPDAEPTIKTGIIAMTAAIFEVMK